MIVTIELDYPPHATTMYGDNAYYSGKHWAQRRTDADIASKRNFISVIIS